MILNHGQITAPSALKLIQGDTRDGDHVVVDVGNGELTFETVETADMGEAVTA